MRQRQTVPTVCSLCVQYSCCLFSYGLALTNGCSSLVLTPAASLTGGGTFTVGSNVNLTCTVTLDNLSIQNTIMVELLNGSTVLMTSSLSGSEHTSVFPFSNVGVSNAGQYQCRATVSSTDSNVVNSNAGVSNNDSLTVQGRSSD